VGYRFPQRQGASPASFGLKTAAELAGGDQAIDLSPPGGPVDIEAFKPGVVVSHPDYGIGRIIAIDGAGPGRKGRVGFAVGPERVFVLAKSPLRPVRKNANDEPPRRSSGRDGHA